MTKAERIYQSTRWECKKHVETWGRKENDGGFNGLITEEITSTRTTNQIQKLIENGRRLAKIDLKLNIFNKEEYDSEMKILDMVQDTLNNQIKNNRKFEVIENDK